MTTFAECFKTILTGGKEESRKAARQVRRILHSSATSRDKYEDIRSLVNDAPQEYAKISEEWRQENFAMAISVLYFLHMRDNEPDFLFPWLFELIQHENGNIRQAAVRMFENELGPLTYHIRCPGEKSSFHDLLADKADQIIFSLYSSLMSVANNLWKSGYDRYKWIASLPTGPYKSVQRVMSEIRDDCGETYMKELEKKLGSLNMNGIELAGLCNCEICKKRKLWI